MTQTNKLMDIWIKREWYSFECKICGFPKNRKRCQSTFEYILLRQRCSWENIVRHFREKHPKEFKEELLPIIKEAVKLEVCELCGELKTEGDHTKCHG